MERGPRKWPASVRRQLVSLVHAGRLTYPGYGLFAPAGFRSEAVRRTIPALVRAVVDRPMRVRDVAAQVGEPPAALNAALAPLIEQGRLSQPEPGVVALAGFYSPPSASEFLVVRNAVQASLTQPHRPDGAGAWPDLVGGPGALLPGVGGGADPVAGAGPARGGQPVGGARGLWRAGRGWRPSPAGRPSFAVCTVRRCGHAARRSWC